MSTSPYNAFRLPRPSTEEEYEDTVPGFLDEDGVSLYETGENDLQRAIILLDDVATLGRYLAGMKEFGLYVLGPRDYGGDDPFFLAAGHGSTNCLEFMLEFWQSAGGFSQTDPELPSPNARDFGLLHTACAPAQVEVFKLLLSSPWQAHFGDVRAADLWGYTPLLMASGSLPPIPKDPRTGRCFTAQEHIARAEEVIRILLGHGAFASEAYVAPIQEERLDIAVSLLLISDTQLSLAESNVTAFSRALCWASPKLLKRLVDEGADINAQIRYKSINGDTPWGPPEFEAGKSSLIHIASKYANVGGFQVLLDNGHALVQQTDSYGRLWLHWAAIGPGYDSYALASEDIIPRIVDTIKLLIRIDSETTALNARDYQGDTALHYATRRTSVGVPGDIGLAIARTLCEHGADASIRGQNRERPLYGLTLRMHQGEPVDTALIDLLLAHGASVSDTDEFGNTIPHSTARHIAHVGTARYLLRKGSNVRAVNEKGNTPLHEAAGGYPRDQRADRVRAQEEMMGALTQGLPPEETDDLLDQANNDGKTPRQIYQETQETWRREEQEQKDWEMRMARGRGRPRS